MWAEQSSWAIVVERVWAMQMQHTVIMGLPGGNPEVALVVLVESADSSLESSYAIGDGRVRGRSAIAIS